MSARIRIDMDRSHPVAGGQWHWVARRHRLPRAGEALTMMCGLVEETEYSDTEPPGIATTCWLCDLAYRRDQGIEVPPDHPALPTPRRCT